MHSTKEHSPNTSGRVIRHAKLYDLLGTKLSRGRNTLLELAAVTAGETVLDVGCGTGTLALAMASRPDSGRVIGIDASGEMIDVARKKAGKANGDVDFQVALIEQIPFPDATFDLVTSSLMLHHLPADLKRAGLAEVRRVLKPGGRFVVMDFARDSHSPLGHLLSVLGRGSGPTTADGLTNLLTAAGFAAIDLVPTRHANLTFIRAT